MGLGVGRGGLHVCCRCFGRGGREGAIPSVRAWHDRRGCLSPLMRSRHWGREHETSRLRTAAPLVGAAGGLAWVSAMAPAIGLAQPGGGSRGAMCFGIRRTLSTPATSACGLRERRPSGRRGAPPTLTDRRQPGCFGSSYSPLKRLFGPVRAGTACAASGEAKAAAAAPRRPRREMHSREAASPPTRESRATVVAASMVSASGSSELKKALRNSRGRE